MYPTEFVYLPQQSTRVETGLIYPTESTVDFTSLRICVGVAWAWRERSGRFECDNWRLPVKMSAEPGRKTAYTPDIGWRATHWNGTELLRDR